MEVMVVQEGGPMEPFELMDLTELIHKRRAVMSYLASWSFRILFIIPLLAMCAIDPSLWAIAFLYILFVAGAHYKDRDTHRTAVMWKKAIEESPVYREWAEKNKELNES